MLLKQEMEKCKQKEILTSHKIPPFFAQKTNQELSQKINKKRCYIMYLNVLMKICNRNSNCLNGCVFFFPVNLLPKPNKKNYNKKLPKKIKTKKVGLHFCCAKIYINIIQQATKIKLTFKYIYIPVHYIPLTVIIYLLIYTLNKKNK